jgi:hypothetical protein
MSLNVDQTPRVRDPLDVVTPSPQPPDQSLGYDQYHLP